MNRMLMMMLTSLLAFVGAASIALAADDAAAQGGQGGFGRGKMGLGFGRGALLRRLLVTPEERKAEFERFKTDLEALRTERQALRDKVVADVKAGKTRAEAIQAHADDFKALFTKFCDTVIAHRQKLVDTAKANEANAVNTVWQKILDRINQIKARLGKAHNAQQPAAK